MACGMRCCSLTGVLTAGAAGSYKERLKGATAGDDLGRNSPGLALLPACLSREMHQQISLPRWNFKCICGMR
eukprot:6210208-Pleurochrysis_carterae.AAC.1